MCSIALIISFASKPSSIIVAICSFHSPLAHLSHPIPASRLDLEAGASGSSRRLIPRLPGQGLFFPSLRWTMPHFEQNIRVVEAWKRQSWSVLEAGWPWQSGHGTGLPEIMTPGPGILMTKPSPSHVPHASRFLLGGVISTVPSLRDSGANAYASLSKELRIRTLAFLFG